MFSRQTITIANKIATGSPLTQAIGMADAPATTPPMRPSPGRLYFKPVTIGIAAQMTTAVMSPQIAPAWAALLL